MFNRPQFSFSTRNGKARFPIIAMSTYPHAARPDCTELDWLSDPSPPLTAAAIDRISQEASRILTETLNQLETGRSVTP